MSARIEVARHGSNLVLTLSNPGLRNALAPEMYQALLGALDQAARDDAILAVILTGADGCFCAGGNLNRLRANRDQPPEVQAASIDALHTMVKAVLDCPKPVIAAVEGAAAGAGYSLVLACDLVVAADDAQFVMAYVKVGLSPDGGGSWQLLAKQPRALALEQLLTGAPVSAPRLHAVGAINRVVAKGSALAEALALGAQFSALSPVAVRAAKALSRLAPRHDLDAHLEAEKDSFVRCLHGPDAGEAIDAFLQKRPARFNDAAS